MRFNEGDLVQVVVPPEVLATHRLFKERSSPVRFERYLQPGDPALLPGDETHGHEHALVDGGWVVNVEFLAPYKRSEQE